MSDSPVGYFSHNLNGYQKFRHTLLCDQIEANFDEVIKGTVVDVGCGSGHLLHLISKTFKFSESIGIDFVQGLLSKARLDYPNLNFDYAELRFTKL